MAAQHRCTCTLPRQLVAGTCTHLFLFAAITVGAGRLGDLLLPLLLRLLAPPAGVAIRGLLLLPAVGPPVVLAGMVVWLAAAPAVILSPVAVAARLKVAAAAAPVTVVTAVAVVMPAVVSAPAGAGRRAGRMGGLSPPCCSRSPAGAPAWRPPAPLPTPVSV